jgi:hypothetical protein
MTAPAEIYVQLRATAPMEPGRAFRAFPAPVGLDVRVFVEGDTRLPGVELECSSAEMPASFQLPKMGGAVVQRVPVAARSSVVIAVKAADESYSEVFIELASRLVEDLVAAGSANAALRVFARRLGAWARFFASRSENGFGRAEEIGLIGELLCLEALGREVGLARAVGAWLGPTGVLYDFVAPRGALEAKATTSSAPPRLQISSARQLDDSVVPALFMCGALLQEVPQGEVSLPVLVARLVESLVATAPGAVPVFEERLTESGYLRSGREREWLRVVVRELGFFRVSDDFPRICPKDLRPGVDDVRYAIPWSLLAGFQVSVNAVGELFNAE